MQKLLLGFMFILSLVSCAPAPEPMQLHQIYQRDSIRIGILNGPTSYFEGPDGATGYEYELAAAFANKLGVKLALVPSFQLEELLLKLKNNEIDLIASGATISEKLQQEFRLAPAYQQSDEVLVYSLGKKRPKSLAELEAPIVVSKGSSQAETLISLRSTEPNFEVQFNESDDSTELLQAVAEGKIRYTLADSHLLAINQRFYPKLGVAFTLKHNLPVAWLMRRSADDSLFTVLIEFFGRSYENAELLTLEDKYFGHVKRFNYADTLEYIDQIDRKLPRYQPLFEKYAGPLDWRLLAAMAYQESRWDPKARSPQGVLGMMMLTVPTAELMNVTSRVDAAQSIRGGSKFLQKLIGLIPERIQQPDRLWFAIAAYNIGLSHVESARKLTEKDGGDPDKWAEVKQRLPLLKQRKYYSQTRTGFARGDHAVYYVENVRRYYDTLLWVDEKKRTEMALKQAEKEQSAAKNLPNQQSNGNTKNVEKPKSKQP